MVTVSLGRTYVSGICSIFPLSMESNVLEKSSDNKVAEIFCMYSFDDLMDNENLWSYVSISWKAVLIFPKNFLVFRLDMIKKRGIINLSNYSFKNLASIALNNSKVTFLWGKEAWSLLSISLLCFVSTVLHIWRCMLPIFSVFYISGDILSRLTAFLLLIF